MPGKILKIKTLIQNKSKLRGAVGQILYEKQSDEILKRHGKTSLPLISIKDLVSVFPSGDFESTVTVKSDLMNGSSPVNDYYFLCLLAKALNIKAYFEIGTWVGISAANISGNTSADTKIYTLDIPHDHPEIKIFNIPPEIFGYYSKSCANVTHLKADSMYFDFSEYQNKMDLVFVDGNHSFDYVVSDSRNALTLLRDDKSVLTWHDYILGGELNKNVLCGILEGMPADEHKHIFYLEQSNMAVYSRSFNFTHAAATQWKLPESELEFSISPAKKSKGTGSN